MLDDDMLDNYILKSQNNFSGRKNHTLQNRGNSLKAPKDTWIMLIETSELEFSQRDKQQGRRVNPVSDYLVKDRKQRVQYIIIFDSKETSVLQESGFVNSVRRW